MLQITGVGGDSPTKNLIQKFDRIGLTNSHHLVSTATPPGGNNTNNNNNNSGGGSVVNGAPNNAGSSSSAAVIKIKPGTFVIFYELYLIWTISN